MAEETICCGSKPYHENFSAQRLRAKAGMAGQNSPQKSEIVKMATGFALRSCFAHFRPTSGVDRCDVVFDRSLVLLDLGVSLIGEMGVIFVKGSKCSCVS